MSKELVSPEGLEIAHTYLENGSSIDATVKVLGLPREIVHQYLNKREVRSYIDQVYMESGFRNRDRMAAIMDEIIAAKLEEMDESGLGSSKDIVDIMKLAHDMKMKELEMQIKLLAAEKPAVQVTNNTQNNYNTLLEKIMSAGG